MSNNVEQAKFRKFTPVDREYPIFELVVDEGEVLLDIGATDEGVIEVAIHEAASNKIFRLERLLEFMCQGKRLLENEML